MDNEAPVPLLKDRDIGDLVGKSESWVRQERSNRQHGRPHIRTVDPVMVGDSPRYRRNEIAEWFSRTCFPINHTRANTEGLHDERR